MKLDHDDSEKRVSVHVRLPREVVKDILAIQAKTKELARAAGHLRCKKLTKTAVIEALLTYAFDELSRNKLLQIKYSWDCYTLLWDTEHEKFSISLERKKHVRNKKT